MIAAAPIIIYIKRIPGIQQMDAWKLDKLRKYWTWTYKAIIMDKVQQCTIFSHFAKLEKLIKPVTLDTQT